MAGNLPSVEAAICPISGCENRVDPECVIEFTIDGVEGLIRATICKYCIKMIGAGLVSGLSLSPVFIPVRDGGIDA